MSFMNDPEDIFFPYHLIFQDNVHPVYSEALPSTLGLWSSPKASMEYCSKTMELVFLVEYSWKKLIFLYILSSLISCKNIHYHESNETFSQRLVVITWIILVTKRLSINNLDRKYSLFSKFYGKVRVISWIF